MIEGLREQLLDALDAIALLEGHGVKLYVDGGWPVGALLGRQTRPDADLDIALPPPAGTQAAGAVR